MEIKIGQQYIGTLENMFQDEIIEITKEMLDDDENTSHFLHYYGFELLNK